MAPATQAYYSDYVADATGHAVAGATVALYPVDLFEPGVLPAGMLATPPPAATTTTDTGGRFAFSGLRPGDYHVAVLYAPAGGTTQTAWRYHVPVAPYEETRRAVAHEAGTAIPRTLARLLGGLPVTLLCLGDGVTVGYNAAGTVGGGWVAGLAARLAAALPAAEVLRYDPVSYATTFDAPIPAWAATVVQPAPGNAPVQGQPAQSAQPVQQVTVINAGVSGDTVLRALRRYANLGAASWSPPPDCYVVQLGPGEMSADPTRAAAPADFAGHLTGLVNLLRAGGAEALLCTPHSGPAGGMGSGSLGGRPDDYAAAVRGVAAATGCGLIDLRGLWQDHYDPAAPNDGYGAWLDTTAGDHLAPTDAGHAAIADEVFRPFDLTRALPVRGPLGTGTVWEHVRLLNTASPLLFTGAWAAQSGFALAGLLASPREMRTSAPGDHLTFTGRFCELYMLARRWHDGGQVTVTVDGATLGTIDLYRGAPSSTADLQDANGAMAPRERIALALGLADAPHTVTLQLAATANPLSQGTVWRFDALEVLRLRQGGLSVEGSEPLQRVQRGTVAIALSGAATGTATITFPLPYAGAPPVVVAQSPHPSYYAVVSAVTAGTAAITLVQSAHATVTDTQVVSWLAFG